jgi:hypothetical protein
MQIKVQLSDAARQIPDENETIERFWRTLAKEQNGSGHPAKIMPIRQLYTRRARKMTLARARSVSRNWSPSQIAEIHPDKDARWHLDPVKAATLFQSKPSGVQSII